MRRIFARMALLAIVLVTMAFLTVGQSRQASAHVLNTSTCISVPVNVSSPAGPLSGTLTICKFSFMNGQLVALGTITGILTTASGLDNVQTQLILPVSSIQANGLTLTVVIVPTNVSVAGITIPLAISPITITAQPATLVATLISTIMALVQSGNLSQIPTLLNTILSQGI